MPNIVNFILGGLFAAAIALTALRLRALSVSGAIAAFFVGAVVFSFGGWAFAWPLLTFFVTSTLLSRWRRRAKESLGYAKGGRRDAGQVFANGGVAAVIAACYPFVSSRHGVVDIYVLYLACLAAANADTWATEIGSAVGGRPISLRTFSPVAPGTSGAVSLAGTVGAAAGALTIAVFAIIFHPAGASGGLLRPFSAGLGGAVLDSFLGGTLQAQWQDPNNPGRLTESAVSGQRPVHGLVLVNNDLVNFLSILFAAIFAWFLP